MFVRPFSEKEMEAHHTRYVIMCCVDVRPFSMAMQPGSQYFAGGLSPGYVQSKIHHATAERILTGLVGDVRGAMTKKVKAQIDSTRELGYNGPVFGVQSDMTSNGGSEFYTLSLSFVPKGGKDIERLMVTTKVFPGRHTASDIEPWIVEQTNKVFEPVLGKGKVPPKDVYIAATVDQGGNMVNVFKNLGIPVQICSGHRLNSGIGWGLGISGTYNQQTCAGACKNKTLRKLMSTMTACAGLFNHAPCNNDELREVQSTIAEMTRSLEVVRRNDTTYSCIFAFFLLAVVKALRTCHYLFLDGVRRKFRALVINASNQLPHHASCAPVFYQVGITARDVAAPAPAV
ncbi:unnamed protein product, partial [Ectocarpus sp. 4 AP-2014]